MANEERLTKEELQELIDSGSVKDVEDVEELEGVEVTEEIDWNEVLSDFAAWTKTKSVTSDRKIDRMWKNVMMMGLTLLTAGVFVFVYLAWWSWQFFKNVDYDDYKVNVYIQQTESEDDDE